MNAALNVDRPLLQTALDEIIADHGFWAVMRAFLARALRRRPKTLADPPISNHIRRDIGLEARAPFDAFAHLRR